ncbi:hypothetical protein RVS70_05280 [Virgibacillus sp. M23]|uniref:hypothetical protein n=1 Tax=Virgibacillus sp. M23 TaxID=3079030 RepID=UPI002A90C2EE|nr:hypothetical protein [Virgibacillus sp. M23]MDY7043613.1 hypothetical protein [Virgibacillus sp. M23]
MAEQEKQKLQKGKSMVSITGKLKLNENSFSGEKTSDRTGYVYSRVNIGIETEEGNVIYAEMMGGYSPSNPIIYAMNKEDNSQLQVNFADRLNETIVDSVSDFRLHKVGLERGEDGRPIYKKYLSPMDVHDVLKEKLVDGMDITVRGSFAFSEYNGETQRKLEIQNIHVPYLKKDKESGEFLPVQYKTNFVQTILLDDKSFKKVTKKDKDAGEVVIPAMAVDYVSKKDGKPFKKNVPFPLAITVKLGEDEKELEKTEKILNALFKVKKGTIRELGIEGYIIEGYDKAEVKDEDIELSDEIKELIDMGLYSAEEAKKKMQVRGNKVRKLVFTRPFLQKKESEDGTSDLKIDIRDNYLSADDLIVLADNEDNNKSDVDSDEGLENTEDDQAWMSQLGL